MHLESYLRQIEVHLIGTHARVLNWFRKEEALLSYRPDDQGWTVAEILEHIALTSHFLLKLIDKGANKALRNVKGISLEEEIQLFDFDLARMEAIGIHGSFAWIRPEHMEPKGIRTLADIQGELTGQLRRCLNWLTELKHGEGLLHKTTMSVNDLGKLNVYEYIYFLSQHAERHLQQMAGNKREFEQFKSASGS